MGVVGMYVQPTLLLLTNSFIVYCQNVMSKVRSLKSVSLISINYYSHDNFFVVLRDGSY